MGRSCCVWLAVLGGCARIWGFDDPLPLDGGPSDGQHADAAPCLSTGLTCAGTVMAMTCNQRCFAYCSEQVSYATAEGRCSTWTSFGHLAIVDDSDLWSCVQQVGSLPSWIGLKQTMGSSTPTTGWKWADGNNLGTFGLQWDTNQPDDGTGSTTGAETDTEDYAIVEGSNKWQDVAGSQNYAFTCSRGGGGN